MTSLGSISWKAFQRLGNHSQLISCDHVEGLGKKYHIVPSHCWGYYTHFRKDVVNLGHGRSPWPHIGFYGSSPGNLLGRWWSFKKPGQPLRRHTTFFWLKKKSKPRLFICFWGCVFSSEMFVLECWCWALKHKKWSPDMNLKNGPILVYGCFQK